jgi:hypothetical protein
MEMWQRRDKGSKQSPPAIPAPGNSAGSTPPATPAPTAGQAIPVSEQTIRTCFESACLWVAELPCYADRNQRKADNWAIASGILAAITSLAIWPVLSDTPAAWAKTLVSVVALASAVCALVPRVKNYAEMAGEARQLVSRYAGVMGNLRDLRDMGADLRQQDARKTVDEFAAIKAKKDALRGLPDRDLAKAKHHL